MSMTNNVLDELYDLDNVLDELYDLDNVLDKLYDLDNDLDKLYDLDNVHYWHFVNQVFVFQSSEAVAAVPWWQAPNAARERKAHESWQIASTRGSTMGCQHETPS